MRGPHDRSVRERAVKAYERGEGSYETVAEIFDIGVATLRRWVRVYRDCGRLEPLRKGGGTPSRITETDVEKVLRAQPDATAVEITAAYNKHRRGGNRVHVSTIKRALHRFGYVVKKNEFARQNNFAPTWWKKGLHSLRK